MSFATPVVLVALVLLPLLVVWYLLHERNRRRAAQAFAAPHMTASVAPTRPRWRRHVPMVAFGLAVAVLILAAAKPQRTVAVPNPQSSIMLLTDVSGSMLSKDVAPDRLTAARNAALKFVAGVPKEVSIGVMAFNETPKVLQSPTRDRAAVRAALGQLRASGSTATGDAIRTATSILTAQPAVGGKRPPASIVLLSDGASVRGTDPVTGAKAAKAKRIGIYTVALGTANGTITVQGPNGKSSVKKVPPDPATLKKVAAASGGQAFATADPAKLRTVYEKLGAQLGRKTEVRQLTAGFAGGALILLLLGSVLSLAWFGRLI